MKKSSNLLFIYISFFGYEKEIINALKSSGHQVYAFDERISNLKIIKIIYRLTPVLGHFLTAFYFYYILAKLQNIHQFNYLFVLKGEVTPRWFIEKIKKRFPGIKTVYYTWDSFQNNPNGLDLIRLFDKKMSFDLSDCEKYNLEHRPLFSSLNMLHNTEKISQSLAASVFTVHSDRLSILIRIINQLKIYGVETKHYAYTRLKNFDRMKYSKLMDNGITLKAKPLSKKELKIFINDAKFIVDINHPNQTGLTMRTFEALVASKKLISTNSNLKKYVFYNENNICIIGRDKVEIPEYFITSQFIDYGHELTELMTLDGWLKEILSNKPVFNWVG